LLSATSIRLRGWPRGGEKGEDTEEEEEEEEEEEDGPFRDESMDGSWWEYWLGKGRTKVSRIGYK
jgi:hypothetical protein